MRQLARAAETGGLRCVWTNHPPNQDAFGPLAWAAEATARIQLGLGVVPVSAHSPDAIRRRLDETGLPLDRLRLGIGSGSGPQPVARAEAALAELRGLVPCELVVAALGPRMCALGGRAADGVLLNALTPAYARESVEHIRQAAATASRPAPQVYALVSVAVGQAGAALQQRAAAFYAQLPTYAAHFERMQAAPADVLLTINDAAELAAHLAGWSGVVDEVVLGPVLVHGEADEALPLLEAASDVFKA